MSDSDGRTVVRTYVPEYQADAWAEAADSMGMSLSEYVRSMVQAGRRGFELPDDSASDSANPVEPHPGHATPGGEGLEEQVLDRLDSGEVVSWDDLVSALSDDFESQLESALDSLMESGEITLDHRRGGYRRREG